MMNYKSKSFLLIAAGMASVLFGAEMLPAQPPHSIPWPFEPGNVVYPIGNNYGEYQNYGNGAYYHDGIDILIASRSKVYAVEDGTVVGMGAQSALYSYVIVGEPLDEGKGYVYAHLAPESIAVKRGASVTKGELLGEVVAWEHPDFDHLHLGRVQGVGDPPWGEAYAVGNPIVSLDPHVDSSAPVFEQAASDGPFLFCRNNDGITCLPSTDLHGEVDIIALVYDTYGSEAWRLAPYRIEVEIKRASDGAVVHRNELVLDDELGTGPFVVETLYKDDTILRSEGNYQSRKFYMIVTNMDNTRYLDDADSAQAWDTRLLEGLHIVTITASDHAGNSTSASMEVAVGKQP